ncbi:hypothetical protein ACFQMF_15305 [Halorubrum rutilum]|uniref:Uncharacterized protein n=1 Tax=Halorubrum rutilum TaxID=1364933 RepID=A0ABD6ARF8_9EURY|nr:hypothetical protein [Halorubrum rutilum]
MSTRDAELVIETWRIRERDLPRVPPEGWETVDRLREAVCLVVTCRVDGVEYVEPFAGSATKRERFHAEVTTDAIGDDHIHIQDDISTDSSSTDSGPSTTANERGDSFDETTKQFDLDEALDRL